MQLKDAIKLISHHSISEKNNAHWADLGCGSGLFTYALASHLQKGSTIYAVDKAPVQLQQLPNPNNIIIHSQQLDFLQQAIPYNNLDGILMANSFHYVADKSTFINNASKHLNANGSFLIVEYDTDKSNHWVPYPASAVVLQEIFAKEGFTSFTKINTIPSVYNSGKMYAAVITT